MQKEIRYKCDIIWVDGIDNVVWLNFAVIENFVWSALVYTHRIGLPPWIILNFLRKPLTEIAILLTSQNR